MRVIGSSVVEMRGSSSTQHLYIPIISCLAERLNDQIDTRVQARDLEHGHDVTGTRLVLKQTYAYCDLNV